MCLNKMSGGMWQAKEINQAPLCVYAGGARASATPELTEIEIPRLDWALASNIMRITWAARQSESGNSSRFNLPSRFEELPPLMYRLIYLCDNV